jgi:predicted ArsR family transcriptional regulator
LLTDMLRTGLDAREVGRADGRRAARARPRDRAGGVECLARAMSRQGFDATVREDGPTAEITLGACGYEQVARRDPHTICQLHLGYAEGYADGLGDVRVVGLRPHDPARAQCVLSVESVP